MQTVSRIISLDSNTRSQIRSAQILTSLAQIISELVQNALDANASLIEVGVNALEWECWVRDNGCGISKSDLEMLASDSPDRRYSSSKAYQVTSMENISTFGFRGEALASAGDICCLEIASRANNSSHTLATVIKGGRRLHFGTALNWKRESHGTMVVIRDAFYNMPVRRKAHPSVARTLDQIKRDICTFALISPQTAFTLEDVSKHQAGLHRQKVLSVPKTSSTLDTFRVLFGKALVERVKIIHEAEKNTKVEGFIGLEGVNSKAYQFIFLNNRLLDVCELHGTIDAEFGRSSFGRHAVDNDLSTPQKPATRRSPRKAEKRPVYVFHIKTARANVDPLLEPSKTAVYLSNIHAVRALLASSMRSFLQENGFLPIGHDESTDSDNIARKFVLDFHESGESSPIQHPLLDKSSYSCEPLIINEPFENSMGGLTDEVHQDDRSQLINDKLKRNNVTGPPEGMYTQNVRLTRLSEGNPPDWIKGIMADWENPTFTTLEKAPKALVPPGGKSEQSRSGMDNKQSLKQMSRFDLSAKDLRTAEVLGQVDCKFVACVAQSQDNRPVLFLVDQHAMDERIRVEHYLKQLLGGRGPNQPKGQLQAVTVEVARLEPIERILLSKREATLLLVDETMEWLHLWGIIVQATDVGERHSGDEYVQIDVVGVPQVLHRKLTQHRELQDLFKDIIDDIALHGVPTRPDVTRKEPLSSEVSWMSAMKTCPRVLLDLTASRACRGSVSLRVLIATTTANADPRCCYVQ
ncbi:DNA mismatch repair protein [Serendipita sp. 397]|nr:DNA mismatch repair protein [Serendipita sp. 397]